MVPSRQSRVPFKALFCGRWIWILLLVSISSLWNGRSMLWRNESSPVVKMRYEPPLLEPALYPWDYQVVPVVENITTRGANDLDGAVWGSPLYNERREPTAWQRIHWTHAIFYHVFIPDSGATSTALEIIREQAAQIAYAAPSNVVTPVYYSLIGPTAARYQAQVQESFVPFPSLALVLVQHLEAGNEDVTLNYLRDYCVQQDVHHRTTTRVTYLHNKGSFHPHEYNHLWRRALTAGALHPDCLQPLNPLSNACGLQFSTRFTVFFPGNMWTARCDYMAQLQPLREQVTQTIDVLETAMLMRLRHQVNMSYWPQQEADWFGIGRFVNEHWIGTHPDLVPTDVDPYCSLNRIYTAATRYAELVGTTATEPALRCRGFVWGPDVNQDILESLSTRTEDRYRDYFAFPALILRWFKFYGRGPPDTSPIWTWYSDGDVWRKAVGEHGIAAVSIVTDQYALPELGRTVRTAFSSRTNESAPRFTESSKDVIFLRVILPSTLDPLYDNVIATMSNQLEIVADAFEFHQRLVYYTVSSRNATDPLGVVQAACQKHAIDCTPLHAVDQDFVGDTMWYTHHYCAANPTSLVTYLSNVISDQDESVNQDELILDLTRGALQEACWRGTETTCSTCGFKFSTKGKLHYQGNMFRARCDYVNQLVPPVQFEPKMNQLAGMAMAAHTRDKIALGPHDVTPSFFGIDHHATEHWIGSHPSIVPCDLAGDGNATTLMEWSTHTDVGKDYQGLDTSMPDHQRLRWYSLLPGNLMKWDYLYDTIPANDSWVWREFPDGQHWKNTVQSQRLRLSTL